MNPPPNFVDRSGHIIRLGREIGRGGEAAIFEVSGQPDVVAKLYHRPPDSRKAAKISAMVDFSTDRLQRLTAWPISTIHASSRLPAVGVLMRNASASKDVHRLYNPKSRFCDFPRANWPFIIHTATNIARAFSVIHSHNVVIGDVNEGSVKVSPESAVVTLIDCDSFQISANGAMFLCEVGVPTYTPPELQGQNFGSVIRTANHDAFGLAVMIFHLVFMGRHPFAGRFLGRGDMPIEKAIGEFRFAFGSDANKRQMQPPPNSLGLADVSPELTRLFEAAFAPAGVNNGRPKADQWVQALDTFKSQLKICSSNSGHHYFTVLKTCPWCAIEARSGIVFFVALITTLQGGIGFNINAFVAGVKGIPDPGLAPGLFPVPPPQVMPSRTARISGIIRRCRVAAGMLIVATGIIGGMVVESGALFVFLVIVGIIIAAANNGRDSDFSRAFTAAESELSSIRSRWESEAGNTGFQAVMNTIDKLKSEYSAVDSLRVQKLRALEQNKRVVQLQQYLSRFSLANARIPNIGPGRKAMLVSYGIDSADDVTPAALAAVPGIGPAYSVRLMTWRQSLEANFVFRPNEPMDPEQIKKIEVEVAGKKSAIERELTSRAAELRRVYAQVLASRIAIKSEFDRLFPRYLQAKADFDAS